MTCNPQDLAEPLAAVKERVFLPDQGRVLIPYLDLTSLNDNDNPAVIDALCRKALTPYRKVAAVCLYPPFVKQAAANLKGSQIKVATVANFPQGNQALEITLAQIKQAIQDGADEIDLVFPYQAYLQGEKQAATSFISQCKACCASTPLKVILETGAFPNLNQIAEATTEVIKAGADFIKTSTGKIPQGATLETAATILLIIKNISQRVNRPLGFKASGGIRDPHQALQYLALAQEILGPQWPTPNNFRIGASSLMDKL